MALRGTNNGGFSFALPAGYDDTRDLSLFVWLRRAGTPDAADRVLTLTNSARTRGLQLTMGGSTLSSAATDLVLSLGSARQLGRGQRPRWARGATGPLSSADFRRWRYRCAARPPATTAAVVAPGRFINCGGTASRRRQPHRHRRRRRQAGGSVAAGARRHDRQLFRWLDRRVAVWQDYRLSAADVAALVGGAALTIAPDKLLFYRPLRNDGGW